MDSMFGLPERDDWRKPHMGLTGTVTDGTGDHSEVTPLPCLLMTIFGL